jgi:molybdopterin synthase catalytic subunit
MNIRIEFTRLPISPPAIAFASLEIGACLEFSGLVRELEQGRKIPGLFYEAYEPMARAQLEKIVRELGARYPSADVLLIHRLAFVPVGELSLYIRVASRHRPAALSFMGELLDRLKTDVPIWKGTEK